MVNTFTYEYLSNDKKIQDFGVVIFKPKYYFEMDEQIRKILKFEEILEDDFNKPYSIEGIVFNEKENYFLIIFNYDLDVSANKIHDMIRGFHINRINAQKIIDYISFTQNGGGNMNIEFQTEIYNRSDIEISQFGEVIHQDIDIEIDENIIKILNWENIPFDDYNNPYIIDSIVRDEDGDYMLILDWAKNISIDRSQGQLAGYYIEDSMYNLIMKYIETNNNYSGINDIQRNTIIEIKNFADKYCNGWVYLEKIENSSLIEFTATSVDSSINQIVMKTIIPIHEIEELEVNIKYFKRDSDEETYNEIEGIKIKDLLLKTDEDFLAFI